MQQQKIKLNDRKMNFIVFTKQQTNINVTQLHHVNNSVIKVANKKKIICNKKMLGHHNGLTSHYSRPHRCINNILTFSGQSQVSTRVKVLMFKQAINPTTTYAAPSLQWVPKCIWHDHRGCKRRCFVYRKFWSLRGNT